MEKNEYLTETPVWQIDKKYIVFLTNPRRNLDNKNTTKIYWNGSLTNKLIATGFFFRKISGEWWSSKTGSGIRSSSSDRAATSSRKANSPRLAEKARIRVTLSSWVTASSTRRTRATFQLTWWHSSSATRSLSPHSGSRRQVGPTTSRPNSRSLRPFDLARYAPERWRRGTTGWTRCTRPSRSTKCGKERSKSSAKYQTSHPRNLNQVAK